VKSLQKSLTKIVKSWWFPWLLAGVFLRLVFSAVTIHPDLWSLNFTSYLFSFNGVINVYDYLVNLSPSHEWSKLYGPSVFTYPPLAYFTLGGFMFIFKPLLNFSFMEWFVNHSFAGSLSNPEIFRQLLILKLPYLFFDLGIAFLLTGFFTEQRLKKIVFLLWIFNPLSFYTSFMVGQFDVIPLFFTVLALHFARNGKNELSVLSLGVGGAFKMFPLLFLPFLVLVLGKTYWQKIKLSFLGILPYVLSILPFLSSFAFRQVSLFSAQSQKMLHMILPVSGAEGIYVFVFFFLLLIFLAGYRRKNPETLYWYFLGVMLLFFSVTHYHPQWFLWLTPFLVVQTVKDKFTHLWLVIALIFTWLFITFSFEPSLNFALFAPLNPNLVKLPGIFEEIRFYDIFQLKSIVRSIAAAASLSLILLTWRKNEKAD